MLLRPGLILASVLLATPALAGRIVIEENDAVKISRVTIAPGETYQTTGCSPDRVIVWVTNQRKRHQRAGHDEVRERAAGDGRFYPATCDPVAITNTSRQVHTSVVVELKAHDVKPYPAPTYHTVLPHVGRAP